MSVPSVNSMIPANDELRLSDNLQLDVPDAESRLKEESSFHVGLSCIVCRATPACLPSSEGSDSKVGNFKTASFRSHSYNSQSELTETRIKTFSVAKFQTWTHTTLSDFEAERRCHHQDN